MLRIEVAFSVREVAERLGVSAHAVLGWIRAGELRAVNVASSPRCRRPSWRISPAALADFEAARSCRPVTRRQPLKRGKQGDVIEFY